MAIRNLVLIGDETLRKKSKKIEHIDQRILTLLDDMLDTLHDEGGAGIAAVQVGVLRRAVVIDMGSGIIKLINPELVSTEGEQEVTEGCLSIPGKRGRLIRPAKVTVKALDENGEPFELTADGDLAKCLCHEIDHLDGILYIDKIIDYVDEEE